MAKAKRTRGSGSLYRRGRIWWMKADTDFGSFSESTGETAKEKAAVKLNKRLAEMQSGTETAAQSRATVEDLYKLVVTDYQQNGQKSLDDVESRWKHHLEPFFKMWRASQVQTRNVEDYKARRLEQGASNASINRELAILRRAYKLGVRQSRASRQPSITLLKEAKPREGFLSDEQYQQLHEACAKRGPWLLAFFETAASLSNRRGELLNLRVGDCDFTANSLTLRDTKNGDTRRVPMLPTVRTLLDMACSGKEAADYVFTRPSRGDGKPRRPVRDMRKDWVAVCIDAGLGKLQCRDCKSDFTAPKCECGCEKSTYKGLLIHDLRRTGVRNMVRRGVSEHVAMKISGHKTVSVFRRYNIISDDDLQHAAKLIEEGRPKATDTLQSGAENSEKQGLLQ